MSGLYIHIPFCKSKCAYCDFFSRPRADESLMHGYVDRLIEEFNQRKEEVDEPFSTVYIGGGTPSVLPPAEFDRLFEVLPSGNNIVEYTVEANPEHITPQFLEWLKSTPVNRLSIGIQSFDSGELKFIGRGHDGDTAVRALELIASSGPANFNADLIYGLPLQDMRSWKRNLTTLLEFRPPHLSAYMLSWEDGTRLNAMRIAGKAAPTADDILIEMYDLLCECMASYGYTHYEISNFALPDRKSIHNSNYWRDLPYLGIGASAHSFTGSRRKMNPYSIPAYLRGEAPSIEDENIDERHNDHLLTALRTADGLNRKRFVNAFGQEAWDRIGQLAKPFVLQDKMLCDSERIAMTESGWLLTDSILVELFR